jgi:hypothetical protein
MNDDYAVPNGDSPVTRLLIVAAVIVSVSIVTLILLIQKLGKRWSVVPRYWLRYAQRRSLPSGLPI